MKTIDEINKMIPESFLLSNEGVLATIPDIPSFWQFKGYEKDIARIIEILVLFAPKNWLLLFAKQYSKPWREQPRAAGLLMRYRDHETNQKLLPWLLSGNSYIKKNGWPSSDANESFYCYDWLKWPDGSYTKSYKMFYALMAVTDSIDMPVLFGELEDLPDDLHQLSPASIQDREQNLKLYNELISKEYYGYDTLSSMREANPKMMLLPFIWLMGKMNFLQAAGWDEQTALQLTSQLFTVQFRKSWTFEQLMYFLYYHAHPDMEERILKAAEYAVSKHWTMSLDETTLKGLRSFPKAIVFFFQQAKAASKINRFSIMKFLIDEKQADSFSWLLEDGFANTKSTVNRLLDYATAKEDAEFITSVLGYKNETEDPIEEMEKQQKREMALLNAKPDSALVLKKLYTWTTLPDGTLAITRYKGEFKEHIIVPAKIGRSYVSTIETDAFNPERRKPAVSGFKLSRVTISEGIESIKDSAFRGCSYIDRVDLPSTLKWISTTAFDTIASVDYYVNTDHLTIRIDNIYQMSRWFNHHRPFIHFPKGTKNPEINVILPGLDRAYQCDYETEEQENQNQQKG